MGEAKGDLGATNIEVEIDKSAKTISIKDKGIGMTKEEIKKLVENAKTTLEKDHESFAKSIKDDLKTYKKK